MLTDVGLQTITLTSAAAQAISRIIAERNLEGYALRVFLAEGSCCSALNFGMALDNNMAAEDRAFESAGVKLIIDPVSLDYLQGAKIDFINDPVRGAGFLVDSPNAHVHDEQRGEGTCACGGSCSCNS